MNTEQQKVWFITGTSKGLGLQLTKFALSIGDKIAATTRDVEALKKKVGTNVENLFPVELDITSDKDVKEAINRVVQEFGRIDVVVNNAGYSLVGSMEEMSDEEFRKTMDVNLFGTVNVIRNVMPYLRKHQSGHIINISSNAGYVGFEKASSYNAAKFGVVGLSEALAQEVKGFGVHVTVVAPGQFRTEFMDSIMYVKNRIAVYGVDEAEKMWSQFSGQQEGDPEKLVQILVNLSRMEQPPVRLLVGPDTYELVTKQRKVEEADFEKWKDLTLSTNFD
ncbi:SDR family NAD(P)-dependent oxidoreductase [Cytophagaceae bacterium DM2B3-1]|uniref:SDR family NAD(P)-dependent oxidoreductase n=1 Tax=Xanthocytophaga flava TaxID=3048013 RepID=A0ABT7CMA8_9BACT|nr:SDR family NAD(P)-dependent oxidoreductase [Xanthocytophaga flavus]MDJ1467715.1 SDR family NAD(P)-dependent oxidoreductase [Xanthocytophaga flavus]MDJ1493794.1 SDR family NAD(P)-dependent oxidoreductase [Xanthocytophaga flavus]